MTKIRRRYSLQKSAWPWLFVSLLTLLVDQLSKIMATECLTRGIPFKLLPFLNLSLNYNRGAAFGFLNINSFWPGPLFTAIASVAITLLILWLWQLPRSAYLQAISITLIIGGAAGNLMDRLFRDQVIDFIDFYFRNWHYPTFNLADTFICVGTALLILALIRER